MTKRIVHLIFGTIVLHILTQNTKTEMSSIFDLLSFVSSVLLVIELQPHIYRFLDI